MATVLWPAHDGLWAVDVFAVSEDGRSADALLTQTIALHEIADLGA